MKIDLKLPSAAFLNAAALSRAIDNGLDAAARGVKVDFQTTTETWSHQPQFAIESGDGERTVATTDPIYGYVSGGTRPHVIVPKRAKVLRFNAGAKPKTSVRVIGSTAGAAGSTPVVAHRVQHPGTEAREFDQVIAEKWEKEVATIMQRAIDAVVGA